MFYKLPSDQQSSPISSRQKLPVPVGSLNLSVHPDQGKHPDHLVQKEYEAIMLVLKQAKQNSAAS